MIRSCTFKSAANLFASRVKQIFFYAVMAAKRFRTRTEEEIEQLLHDKSSKSTNKATHNAVRTLRDFCYVDPQSAKPRGTLGVSGKQNSLFPLGRVIQCLIIIIIIIMVIIMITSRTYMPLNTNNTVTVTYPFFYFFLQLLFISSSHLIHLDFSFEKQKCWHGRNLVGCCYVLE